MLDRGKLYIGSVDKSIYALGADSGKEFWSMQLGGPIWSAPSSIDENGIFYIGCSDKNVYAINSRTQEIVWKYPTLKPVLSYPRYRNGVIHIGSNDKKIHSIDAKTGKEAWEPFKTRGAVTGKAAFYTYTNALEELKELLIIGSGDYSVYAIDTAKDIPAGESRKAWSQRTGGAISSSPCVDGDSVFVTSGDGKIYCFDARVGNKNWEFSTNGSITSSPIVVDGVVYFGSSDFHFYAVSSDKGELLWKYKTEGEIIGGACISGDYIIVGSNDYKIYCFVKD
jgi:outer membrane protein assembly factor BamB